MLCTGNEGTELPAHSVRIVEVTNRRGPDQNAWIKAEPVLCCSNLTKSSVIGRLTVFCDCGSSWISPLLFQGH